MSELSVFIDESGDFGAYEPHSPYYVVTLVFHDQSVDISQSLSEMQSRMRQKGIPDYTVHAGPLIRREGGKVLKGILPSEENELVTSCYQLKMLAPDSSTTERLHRER
jgi:hypothetical protein